MITKTALSSRSYLARIKAAVVEAVREAHAPHRSALGIGHAVVKDRRQRFSLRVVWRRGGKGLECFDRQDNDVTARVLEALRSWHAECRLPRIEVAQATESEWLEACQVAGRFPIGLGRIFSREGA